MRSCCYVGLQIDHTTNRVAMISDVVATFSFLDLGTGEVFVVSGPDRGEGPELINLKDLLYFATTGRIFVVDSSHDTIMEIADNGDRQHRTMLEE